MDKLLGLIDKLKNEIVPGKPLGKMTKADLLAFIRESNFLERMRTFHQKVQKGIRSALTDDEAPLVPSESSLDKMSTAKLRRLIRNFHRATQILKKYAKFSPARLRSHVKRHRYEEMLYGQDLPVDGTDDEEEKKKQPRRRRTSRREGSSRSPRRRSPRRRSPRPRRVTPKKTAPSTIIINTGDQATPLVLPVPEKKDPCGGCCPEKPNKLADQDFFGLIQSLAPNLYKALAEKAFLLDMCTLDRKRMEANVCPVDCRPKAWDEFACCERDEIPLWFIKWQAGKGVRPSGVAAPGVAAGPGVAGVAGAPGVPGAAGAAGVSGGPGPPGVPRPPRVPRGIRAPPEVPVPGRPGPHRVPGPALPGGRVPGPPPGRPVRRGDESPTGDEEMHELLSEPDTDPGDKYWKPHSKWARAVSPTRSLFHAADPVERPIGLREWSDVSQPVGVQHPVDRPIAQWSGQPVPGFVPSDISHPMGVRHPVPDPRQQFIRAGTDLPTGVRVPDPFAVRPRIPVADPRPTLIPSRPGLRPGIPTERGVPYRHQVPDPSRGLIPTRYGQTYGQRAGQTYPFPVPVGGQPVDVPMLDVPEDVPVSHGIPVPKGTQHIDERTGLPYSKPVASTPFADIPVPSDIPVPGLSGIGIPAGRITIPTREEIERATRIPRVPVRAEVALPAGQEVPESAALREPMPLFPSRAAVSYDLPVDPLKAQLAQAEAEIIRVSTKFQEDIDNVRNVAAKDQQAAAQMAVVEMDKRVAEIRASNAAREASLTERLISAGKTTQHELARAKAEAAFANQQQITLLTSRGDAAVQQAMAEKEKVIVGLRAQLVAAEAGRQAGDHQAAMASQQLKQALNAKQNEMASTLAAMRQQLSGSEAAAAQRVQAEIQTAQIRVKAAEQAKVQADGFLRDRVAQAEKTAARARADLDRLRSQGPETKADPAVERRAATAEATVAELKYQLGLATGQLRLIDTLRQAESVSAQAKQELAKASQDPATAQQIGSLQQARADAEQRVTDLKYRLGVSEERVSGLADTIARERGVSADAIKQLADLQSQLQAARAQSSAAGQQGSAAASAAASKEQDLTRRISDLAGRLKISEKEVVRLGQEVLVGPLKATSDAKAQISALEATRDQLKMQLRDLQERERRGDQDARMDVDTAKRDMAAVEAQLSAQYSKGQQAGVQEGRAAAQAIAASEASRERIRADSRLQAVQDELDRMRSKIARGEGVNSDRIAQLMREHAQALATEVSRADSAVAAAQLESEEALTAESRAHKIELEGRDVQVRTAEQELARQRLLSTEALSAERLRSKTAVSRATEAADAAKAEAKALSDRLLAEAKAGVAEEQDRSKAALAAASRVSRRELEQQKTLTQQQADATLKAQAELVAASKAEQVAKLGQTSAIATITKRDTEIKRVTDLLASREAKMRSVNAAKIAELTKLADLARDKDVAHAVGVEQAKMRAADLNYKSQLQQKDAEIARHQQNHTAANQDMLQAQQKHDRQMAAMQQQIATAHADTQNTLASLNAQKLTNQKFMSELQAASEAKQLSDGAHEAAMRQAKQTQESLVQATMQVNQRAQMHVQALGMRASQHAAIAAQKHAESLAASRAESQRAQAAQQEQLQLMAREHQNQMDAKERLQTIHRTFNQMHTSLVSDPSHLQTLQHMRTEAQKYGSDEYIQGKLSEAEALRAKWSSELGTLRTAADVAQTIVEQKEAPKEDPAAVQAPLPESPELAPVPRPSTPPPLPMGQPTQKRPRSSSFADVPTEEKVEEPRQRVRSLQERIGKEEYSAFRAKMEAQISTGMRAVSRGQLVETSGPSARVFQEFNQNPTMDVSSLDPKVQHKVQKMQESLREADAEAGQRRAQLKELTPDARQEELESDRYYAMMALYDAKQRRLSMEEATRISGLAGDAETDAAIAASEVKYARDLQVSNQEIEKNRVSRDQPFDPLWGDKPEQIARSRAKNAEYLKMEIRVIEREVQALPLPEPVKQQIVAERLQIVRKAAREDRVDQPNLPKAQTGPRVKQIIQQRKVIKKAVEYVAKPWWKVAQKTEFKPAKVVKIVAEVEETVGPTIAKKVEKQRRRINKNMKNWLKKKSKLGKYSLAANPAAEVLSHVKNNPFVDVDPAELAKLIESYKTITEDATPVEAATQAFKVAKELIVEIEETKAKLEGRSLAPTRTVPRPSAPRRKKARKKAPAPELAVPEALLKKFESPSGKRESPDVEPELVTRGITSPEMGAKKARALDVDPTTGQPFALQKASGLASKPRKRSKRASSKSKKKKRSSSASKRKTSEPKTALEKWKQQTKIFRKMRL